jgi:hypothetical protein
LRNLHQITATRNKARQDRRAYRPQPQWRSSRRNSYVEAQIAVSSHGDTFGVTTVVYQPGQAPKPDFILLKPGEVLNAQRAWLAGYHRVCAWVEMHEPDAGVYIVSADERRRAA